MSRLDDEGGGIILYLEQEGRGLGLANKMRAYKLQDDGLDTLDANTMLGFDDDERDYGIAVRMLQILGCTRVKLMTNNPAKLDWLTKAGIEVCGRIPLHGPVNADNRRYLTAKAMRAGHKLDNLTIEPVTRRPSEFESGHSGRGASMSDMTAAAPGYTLTARVLHWIVAALVLLMIPLGDRHRQRMGRARAAIPLQPAQVDRRDAAPARHHPASLSADPSRAAAARVTFRRSSNLRLMRRTGRSTC